MRGKERKREETREDSKIKEGRGTKGGRRRMRCD